MNAPRSDAPRWLIVGASGLLGHGMCQHLLAVGAHVTATVHSHPVGVAGVEEIPWSLGQGASPDALIETCRPDAVLYAAGLTSVDQCESDEALADFLHADAPAALAAAARRTGGRFVYISTDHLWDGSRSMVEEDEPVQPLNAYARSKAKGEAAVLEADPAALLIRTNFFGRGRVWRQSLSDWMLARLRSGQPLNAFEDAHFTPIAVPLLCEIIGRATDRHLSGVYHACGRERLSKLEFALRLAAWCHLAKDGIRPGRLADAGLIARRPADMSLSTRKLSQALSHQMPDVAESLFAVFGPQGRRDCSASRRQFQGSRGSRGGGG